MDDLARRLLGRDIRAIPLGAERVLGITDGSQGIPQLMAEHGQEFVLAVPFFGQLRRLPLDLIVLITELADVRMRSEPAEHLAAVVADRASAQQEPAKTAVLAAQRKRVFPGLAGVPRVLHALEDPLDVVRMMQFGPTPALHLLERRPRIVIPALVVPVNPAVRV